MSRVDTAAARGLTAAALVALGLALAVSGLAWSADVLPGVMVTGFRPPAGSVPAFVATLAAGAALFRVRELTWTDRPRAAMWTAFAGGLTAAFGAWAAVGHTGSVSSVHFAGPAALLTPLALGAGAALSMLASSSLYEALHRDPLPAVEIAHARARIDAVMRAPESAYYVYY